MSDRLAAFGNKPVVGKHTDPEDARGLLFAVRVHFDGNEMLVQVGDDARICEGFVLHYSAGAAPIGIKMDKYFLVFVFTASYPLREGLPLNFF